MPNIHIDDWSDIRLSDFPRHKCLCELCDCGCFGRTNKPHTNACKKKNDGVGAYFGKSRPSEQSLYNDSYKKQLMNLNKPKVFGEPPGNIEIGDKYKKLPKSTNNDEFRHWDSYNPAKSIPEKPESTSKILYPSRQRAHLTTNDELFLNYQGNFKAKPSGFDVFAGSFKIDQNSYDKLGKDSNTVYRDDFLKSNNSVQQSTTQREEIMTKVKFENAKSSKAGKVRMRMDTTTNNMQDFLRFDADLYREIIKNNKNRLSANVFESSLRQGLKPSEETGDQTSIFTSRSVNNFYGGRRSNSMNIYRTPDTLSLNTEIVDNTPDSTYKFDFKKKGVDLCMSKAYKRVGKNIL